VYYREGSNRLQHSPVYNPKELDTFEHGRDLCRGKPFNYLVRELQEGLNSPSDDTQVRTYPGGLSGTVNTCYDFSTKGDFSEHDSPTGWIPSIYVTKRSTLTQMYPDAKEVCYTKQAMWHDPKLLDSILSPGDRYARRLNPKFNHEYVDQAMRYLVECEVIMPERERYDLPPGEMNVLLSQKVCYNLWERRDGRGNTPPIEQFKEPDLNYHGIPMVNQDKLVARCVRDFGPLIESKLADTSIERVHYHRCEHQNEPRDCHLLETHELR